MAKYAYKTTAKAPERKPLPGFQIDWNKRLPKLYKTRYLAIDQSLASTGVIATDYRLYVKRALTIPTPNNLLPEARIQMIGEAIDAILRIEGGFLHFVAIESPAFNAMGLRDVLHGVYWEIRRRCYMHDHNLKLIIAPIGSWKKYSAGHGRAEKPQIRAELTRRYGVNFHSQDLYDAYGILRWAVAKWKGQIKND